MSTDTLGSLLTVHAADPEAAKTFISGLLASSGLLLRYSFFFFFFFSTVHSMSSPVSISHVLHS